MSKTKRKRYSADFKAKVALDAIKGDLTIAQLVAKHGIHQTLINGWKKQATDRLSTLFEIKPEGAERRAKPTSRSCTRRSASWWWNGIF
jgi:transposase-like protein